jgi:hypothetical protein
MTPGGPTLAAVSWAASLRTWLLEPAAEAPAGHPGHTVEVGPTVEVPAPAAPRIRIAVIGLGPGCGTTTVARGIAAALAARDTGGTAIVASSSQAAGTSLPPLRAAARLAAGLPGATATGRLCLWPSGDPAGTVVSAAPLAPIVFDVPHDGPASDSASLADATVLVVPGDAEPALAELAAGTLARHGRAPFTVVNRPAWPDRWDGRATALLPDSRVAARLTFAGWQPPGRLGQILARLADECEAAA